MRSFFSCTNQNGQNALGLNINLWTGFSLSVRLSEMGFNLNVDGKNNKAKYFQILHILIEKN